MHELFLTLSEWSAGVINFMALIVIVYGALEAAIASAQGMILRGAAHSHINERFVRFGRWLVVGLTFQLAADVIETATTTTEDGWADIGRLAAIAVIRTFLSYFLERDMKEMAEAKLAEAAAKRVEATQPHASKTSNRNSQRLRPSGAKFSPPRRPWVP